MTNIYEDVELQDMSWNEEEQGFFYPCPCGDQFFIEAVDLLDGQDLAKCPSCSLIIRVIYDPADLEEMFECESEEEGEQS